MLEIYFGQVGQIMVVFRLQEIVCNGHIKVLSPEDDSPFSQSLDVLLQVCTHLDDVFIFQPAAYISAEIRIINRIAVHGKIYSFVARRYSEWRRQSGKPLF